MIQLKRIYDAPSATDGYRVLVDRLWPRGIKKENAHIDLWLKDVAPSNELRKWFGHDPAKWQQFCSMYADEIRSNPALLIQLERLLHQYTTLTLLFAAKDTDHNNAVVVKLLLDGEFLKY